MSSYHSYPSIYNLGHRVLEHLFDDPVLIEEKIDGSQFSFGRFNGELKARSRGKEIVIDAPDKMFVNAIAVISSLDLTDGWTYRGEYLQKPKHNALAYNRIPNNHIIVFDINIDEENYLPYDAKVIEAGRIGLEVVPRMAIAHVTSSGELKSFLENTSVLGGVKIEGVVIKNYSKFGPDKKVLMGKFVSEAFKEVHKKEWGESNPGGKDIIVQIIEMVKTEARWNKAVQHLREAGQIEEDPRDIGKLIIEVKEDIADECAEMIKYKLYLWAKDHVLRGAVSGLPEWYKNELMNKQFNK